MRRVVINLWHCYCAVTDSLNPRRAHGSDLFTKTCIALRRNLRLPRDSALGDVLLPGDAPTLARHAGARALPGRPPWCTAVPPARGVRLLPGTRPSCPHGRAQCSAGAAQAGSADPWGRGSLQGELSEEVSCFPLFIHLRRIRSTRT